MNTIQRLCLAAAAAVFCPLAVAQQWHAQGELGGVMDSGNADMRTFDGRFDGYETWDGWKEILDLDFLRASASGVETADRLFMGSQTNYALTDRAYGFGGVHYEHDEFSGFLFQADVAAGMGYKIFDTEGIRLDGKFGVGARRIKNEVTGHDADGAIWTAGLDFSDPITKTTRLVDHLSIDSGSTDTQTRNYIGLQVQISTQLGMALGYEFLHNSKPPTPYRGSEQFTTLNLVFGF